MSFFQKWNDFIKKKKENELSTKNAIEEDQKHVTSSSKNAQAEGDRVKRRCCARCGIGLSTIPRHCVKTIGDQQYCDICETIVLQAQSREARQKHDSKTPLAPVFGAKRHLTCARCKRSILDENTVWIGSHRFCPDCAQSHAKAQEARVQMQKTEQAQKIVNVLVPTQKHKETSTPQTDGRYPTCAKCKRIVFDKNAVWMDSHRFCPDCAQSHAKVQEARVQVQSAELTQQLVNVLAQVKNKKKEDTFSNIRSMQAQRLANALIQIQKKKQEESMAICSVCRCRVFEESMIFVNGAWYCEDCYSFTYGKSSENIPLLKSEPHQISYEIDGIVDHTLFSCVVDVADRLITGGFRFSKTRIGGDANHTGSNGLKTSYTDYDAFKQSMDSDIVKRQLNYSYICAFLARNTLKVYILAENGRTVLRWFDTSDKAFATTRFFTEQINEEVYEGRCMVKQIDNIVPDDDFFDNWLRE